MSASAVSDVRREAPDTHGASGPVDPRALGLAAFATTTFAFGLFQTTVWPAGISAALSLGLVYGGGIQVLAGIWAFARRVAFAATVFCAFGAFYISYYVFTVLLTPGLSASDVTTAKGVFLLSWLIFSFYVLIASLGVSVAAVAVYFFWWLTYLLLVIGDFLPNGTVVIAGGAAGVATAAAAWYASSAFLINDTYRRNALPFVSPRQP